MSTSFIFRNNNSIMFGMNFDSFGAKFSIVKKPESFSVEVMNGHKTETVFAVNSAGVILNSLFIESSEKEQSQKQKNNVATIPSYLTDLLKIDRDEKDFFLDIDTFLQAAPISSDPRLNIHSMIANKNGDVWITEAGRGFIKSPKEDSKALVMTNFSLLSFKESQKTIGSGIKRYVNTMFHLDEAGESLSPTAALSILSKAKHTHPSFQTRLSIVYSSPQNTITYCLNSDFKQINKHQLSM